MADICPNSLAQEHIKEIATLKEKVKEHDKKLDKQDELSEAIIEIRTFIKYFKEDAERREEQRIAERKQSIEDAKVRDAQMSELTQTLKEIRTSITDLNTKAEDTDEKVDKLEKKFNDAEGKNLITIDTREEAKKNWWKKHSLPIGITGSILGALSLIAGILKILGII